MKTIIFATGNKNKLVEIREILGDLGYEIESMKQAGMDFDILEDGKTFEENSIIKASAVRDFIKAATTGTKLENPHIESAPGLGEDRMISEEMKEKLLPWKDAIVLADDSGLEIDALNKEPGIYSTRYMGHDTSYDIKNNNLIERLNGVPDEKRTARFVCAVAAAFPDGHAESRVEAMEGRIGYEIAGANGFGYDPIFYLPEFGMTSAEITPEQKNEISHRGKALRAIREVL